MSNSNYPELSSGLDMIRYAHCVFLDRLVGPVRRANEKMICSKTETSHPQSGEIGYAEPVDSGI